MTEPRAAPRVAVWGHFSGRNLGDELVVQLILDAFRRRRPGEVIAAVSMSVADTESRHGVPTYPINHTARHAPKIRPGFRATEPSTPRSHVALRHRLTRRLPFLRTLGRVIRLPAGLARELLFVFGAYRFLQGIDVLVVSGSGQLIDAWASLPYTIFRWSALARLSGTRMIFPSVGAGPIERGLSPLMIRKAVDWADYVTVRSPDSVEVLRRIGVRRELPVRPDMGWSWHPDGPVGEPPTNRAAVVGVNPMAHEDPRYWQNGDLARYQVFLEKMVEFVGRLLADGQKVVLFSSQPSSDGAVVADLEGGLAARGLAPHPLLENATPSISGTGDLIRVIRGLDYVVAGRFHSVLLPLALGIPTIGLAYHPKTEHLLELVGRSDLALDIDAFTAAELLASLEQMRAGDTGDERRRLRARAGELRDEVERQFDVAFGERAEELAA